MLGRDGLEELTQKRREVLGSAIAYSGIMPDEVKRIIRCGGLVEVTYRDGQRFTIKVEAVEEVIGE